MSSLDLSRPDRDHSSSAVSSAMPYLRRRAVRRKDVRVPAPAPSKPLDFSRPDRKPSSPTSSGLDLTGTSSATSTPISPAPVVPKVAPTAPTRQVRARDAGPELVLGQQTLTSEYPSVQIPRLQAGLGVLAGGFSDAGSSLVCLWEDTQGQRGLATGGISPESGRQLVRIAGPSKSTVQPQPWLSHFRGKPSVGINLRQVKYLRRVILIASSAQARSWAGTDLELQIGQGTIFVPSAEVTGTVLALASVTVVRGELIIYREDESFETEQELAQSYGFPLHWATARTTR